MRRGLLATLIALAALLATPNVGGAAVIAPNTTADEFDATPDATCSLREAVESIADAANFGGCAASGAYNNNDTIQLAPGTYELTIPRTDSTNATGDLNFIDTLAIEGLPGGPVVIDANGIDRIVFFSTSLTLRGVTLTGGFVDNPAMGSSVVGGAIASSGGSSLTISNSTISGNRSDGGGGGISIAGPTSLTNVTVSGNTSTEFGGGGIRVSNNASATLTLDNVTVTNNVGLQTDNPAQNNVTGGVHVESGAPAASFHNSIVAGNSTGSTTVDAPDCQGAITSAGGNVIGDTGDPAALFPCTFTSMASDDLNVAAQLSALGDFGGTSQTHALLDLSPAIDNGVATCQMLDQRGIARTQGTSCDSGAYELVVGDTDRDGVADAADNCPDVVNPSQQDNDGDGIGNVCDPTPDPPPASPPAVQPAALAPQPPPECATLRAKLKKAKSKAKKRKIRKRLRQLGC